MATVSDPAQGRTWRVTTAVRVFALALASGRALPTGDLDEVLIVLALLAGLALLTVLVERTVADRALRWTPALESLVLVTVLMSSRTTVEPWLVCLAVPPLVAGIRHGWVSATNTTLLSAVALTVIVASPVSPRVEDARSAAFWLTMGVGTGLLAGWQSRRLRALEERQAPFAAARELMRQLHALAAQGRVGLDSVALADQLSEALSRRTGAAAVAVLAHGPVGLVTMLASRGDASGLSRHLQAPDGQLPADVILVSLQGSDRRAGSVVAERSGGWTRELREEAESLVAEFALRLETAVLFDDVRDMATSQERTRLAREIHDRVAQEIVALGYVVDEIESMSDEPETRRLAASLRTELTRIVTELRYSIYDLRHEVGEHRLSGALTDYVQQLTTGTDLRAHLLLDESGDPLPPWVEGEILRIAQEALGNVRKHARAENVWVSFVSDGTDVLLSVEDDGVGNAMPRQRHWGLQTMRERASSIGADLTVTTARSGGTIVRLQSPGAATLEGRVPREHDRSARG